MHGMSISLSLVSQLQFQTLNVSIFSDLGASKVSQYASMIRRTKPRVKQCYFFKSHSSGIDIKRSCLNLTKLPTSNPAPQTLLTPTQGLSKPTSTSHFLAFRTLCFLIGLFICASLSNISTFLFKASFSRSNSSTLSASLGSGSSWTWIP